MNQRVVFMGTPAFAVASLEALLKSGVQVAGVVTAPDRPAGRGQQLRMSAVKAYAMSQPSLRDNILQPEKLKDPHFLSQLDALDASLFVVVAFRMLPEVVWTRPSRGTINLHASLLPDYRGAAPINWALINGEERTGVTTFFIRHEIDTGDVISREQVEVGPEENAGELHDRLMTVGAELLSRTVIDLLADHVVRIPQAASTGASLHHAPKLTPAIARIDWSKDAMRVHDLVRGLSPHPGAWCMWEQQGVQQQFKLLRTRITDIVSEAAPGSVLMEKGRLLIRCGHGWLEALEVQPENKRRMDAAAFVRGLRDTNDIMLR